MRKGKYVVGTINGLDTAVVFHRAVAHRQMAKVLDGGAASSAGFFCILKDGARTYVEVSGGSTSLGINSAEGDAQLIIRAIGAVPAKAINAYLIEFDQ